MANRKRAEARRKAQAKAARRGQSVEGGEGGTAGVTINIWVIIGVLILVAIGGVIWATSGDDDSKADNPGTGVVDTNGDGDIPDSQPIILTGGSLPTFDPDNTGNVAPVGELPDPVVGLVAPTISGLDFEGDVVTADAATNGAYMLVFLAHWCPHCNAEVPRLLDWKGTGAVPADLDVIGVATAVSPSAPNYPPHEWFSNKGWSWPVIVDESLGDQQGGLSAVAYGLSGYPYFVIVGADGLVKARASGEVSVADLQRIVDDALSG